MTDLAKLNIDGPVATLAFNRAEQRNALSIELLDALHVKVDQLAEADGVVVTVITGAGRAFCAGMDLKQVIIDADKGGSGKPDLPRRLLASLGRLTVKIRTLPSVVVAKVNGAAIGGGCGLACVCDAVVTHEDAKLGFPEVDLGLCPAVVAPWLVRKIGAGPARAVLLRGGVMSGGRAGEIGIADVVCPDRDSLDAATDEVVRRYTESGALALTATKNLLNDLDRSRDETIVLRGAELSAGVLATEQAQASLVSRLR
ncbi:MAG: enoyl-CoA hydratase/isomerase family protein [Phycisphaeraceae bacterium]|nr:MAG: enoyl-CoA hydratase/isomerase family protein [Phycisphaeraceae bacterium]